MTSSAAFRYDDSSEARNRIAPAISAGEKKPSVGEPDSAFQAASAPPCSATRSGQKSSFSQIGVRTPPGDTTFTRIFHPAAAHSRAAVFENMRTAALLAQ